MPFCEKCGNQTSPDSLFCGNCGIKLKASAIQTTLNNQQTFPQNNQVQTDNTKTTDPSSELSVGLNLLSLLFPILGLIFSIVFRNKRPLQASCCKANMILGFIICGICMTFVFILLAS